VASPAPSKSNTGLIIAVVVVLILLVGGGGAGAWWYLSQNDSSTPSTAGGSTPGTTGGGTEENPTDDKETAAEVLTAMYHALGDNSLDGFCDGFLYGADYIYYSKDHCLENSEGWLESDFDTMRKDMRDIEVSVSSLHETEDDTLTIRDLEMYAKSSETRQGLENWEIYDVTVLAYDSSEKRWGVAGWRYFSKDDEAVDDGVVPQGAKDLSDKGA
jgi:hypothetical protein